METRRITMTFNQFLYSLIAAALTTYAAHHMIPSDVLLGVLVFVAHALHVQVTKAMGDETST